MIITIGTGSGVDDGIVFSIRQQNPNLLFFIYSAESEKTLNNILTKLSKNRDDNDVIVKQLNEVNDVEILYQEYSDYIDEIIKKGYTPEEIVADYTSGTKSMSAALVSASIAREIKTLSYVAGSRDVQGRVMSGTERPYLLSPSAIFTQQKIKFFKELFNHYQFDSAYSLLESTNIHPTYKEKINFYMVLSEAYGQWDRFNFKQASEKLNLIDLKIAVEHGLKKLIEEHKTDLHKLKEGSEESKLSEIDLVDLLSNAKRRFDEGKYDDAVSRLYRLVEMIAQIEFEKEFQIKTDAVSLDFLPDTLKKKYAAISKSQQKVELGLFDAFKVLDEKAKNKRAKTFFEKQDKFKKLLFVRNYSRLAHGQAPIKKDTCQDFISFIEETFEVEDKIKFPKLK